MQKSRLLIPELLLILGLVVFAGVLQGRAADEPTIGEVTVVANPQSYSGPCPARVRFTGTIAVLRPPMTFNYHWERSDGAKGPIRVVHVRNASARTVTVVDSWQLGTPGQRLRVWEKLVVNCGNTHITTSPAEATISCR
jgi:hypothetical protein